MAILIFNIYLYKASSTLRLFFIIKINSYKRERVLDIIFALLTL